MCVCSQSASCVGHFYSKLNMAISFSEGFKGLQLTDLSISRDTTWSPLLAYKSAILSITWLSMRGAMAALQGEEFHVIGHAR